MGQHYQYNFRTMKQLNTDTGKEREIRPPPGFRQPKQELLPSGPMTIITVGTGQPGTSIQVNDANNPGQKITVYVPPTAKPGQKMAVPIPQKGETLEKVQAKQKKHDEEKEKKAKSQGWSTGAKVAAGGAALVGIGAVGVGGVILGDHLAGGDMAADMGDGIVDAGEAIGDVAGDVAEGVGDGLEDAGDFIMDLF